MGKPILKQSFIHQCPEKQDIALRSSVLDLRLTRPEDEQGVGVAWATTPTTPKSWVCFWRQNELPILFASGGAFAFDALESALSMLWGGLREKGLRGETLLYASGRRVPVEAMKTSRYEDITKVEMEARSEGWSCGVPDKRDDAFEAERQALVARMRRLPTEDEDSEGRSFERHDWLVERPLLLRSEAGEPDQPITPRIALPHLQKPEHAPRAAHLMDVNGEIWACPIELSPFMGEAFVYGPDRISAMHAGFWFLVSALDVYARRYRLVTPEGEAFKLPFEDRYIIPWDEPPAQGIPTGFVLPEWSPLSV